MTIGAPPGKDRPARYRAVLHKLHRDTGFLALGLTIVYGVSGVAVNHRHHWNYNQSTDHARTRVGTPVELLSDLTDARRAELIQRPESVTDEEVKPIVGRITAALGRARPPRNTFWRGPDRLSLFYEAGDRDTIDYHPSTGVADNVVMRDRLALRSMNFLHLNEGRGIWTYVADLFAVALVFLGVSGALMVKGKHGLRGRGGVLVAVGVVVPLVGLLLMRWI